MFTDPERPPKQGETFRGTLTFETAGEAEVAFAAQPIGAAEPDHGASGHGPLKR